MSAKSPLERMKTKNFYMVLVLVVVSTISIWMFTYPSTSFRTIVSKTQTGIKNLPSNIKNQAREVKELTIDPIYLRRLGLASNSASLSGGGQDGQFSSDLPPPKTTLLDPVIASGVKPDLFKEAAALTKSVRLLLPNYKLIMYDLGLGTSELGLLNKYCNSTWNCEVRTFQFQKYPSHVGYLDIRSYRPVCIQEILNEHGAVIWVDEGYYFKKNNLTVTLASAKRQGIQGWKIKDPTSSFTHFKMFKYFNTDQRAYYFQHAVESSHLVIYNTEWTAKEVMLPWVKCALLEECISPPGAQNTGCNYFRKPLFRYTGCHRYDMSALNVILGKAFKFDESQYTSDQDLFSSLKADLLKAESKTQPAYEMRLGMVQQVKI